MPRLSQADDKDPPAEITPELWKPPLRASEALIELIGRMRDGAAIGGSDPFALAIAGTPVNDEGNGDADKENGSAVSTHVKGPRRWFESRSTTADAVSIDFDWVANFILLTLRQLQMARQWRRQAEIVLSFDDLTEGHYGDRLMPFLEQAAEDRRVQVVRRRALPQVKRRVAELEREKSACHAAIEKCRRAARAADQGRGAQGPVQPARRRAGRGRPRHRQGAGAVARVCGALPLATRDRDAGRVACLARRPPTRRRQGGTRGRGVARRA